MSSTDDVWRRAVNTYLSVAVDRMGCVVLDVYANGDHVNAAARVAIDPHQLTQAVAEAAYTRDMRNGRAPLVIDRDVVEEWAGTPLTDDQFARLATAIPQSSIPQAIGSLVQDSFGTYYDGEKEPDDPAAHEGEGRARPRRGPGLPAD